MTVVGKNSSENSSGNEPVVNLQMNDTLYAVKAILPDGREDIQIGRLGSFAFPKGEYVYVGSAKRNIESRVERHVKIDKKLHWHFDFFRPYLRITEIQTFSGEEGECNLFQRLMKENKGSIPVPGFGSSDCKCQSHLFYKEKGNISL